MNDTQQNNRSALILINWKGHILPMSEEEYNAFIESLQEWDN